MPNADRRRPSNLEVAGKCLTPVGELASSLTIFSAMVTPAVLMMACDSLLLMTSQRLSRIMDHIRDMTRMFQHVQDGTSTLPIDQELQALWIYQLDKDSRRCNHLQRAMVCLYFSLCMFVGTITVIGFEAVLRRAWAWL